MSASTRMARHWLARGQTALQAGRRAEALAALRQAVSADPNCVDALLWLAGLCDNPTDSLRHLTRALTLDPQNEAAHDGIRWARKRLHERGETAAAIPRFLDTPAPQPLRQPDLVPVSVPVVTPASSLALAYRPSASVPVRENRSYTAWPPIEVASIPPKPVMASTAKAATAAAPRELTAAPRGATGNATATMLPVPRRLALGAIAVWTAVILVLSGGIVWLAAHPASALEPAPVAARAPEVVPLPAATASLAPVSAPAAEAPVAEAPVGTTNLYAQRADQALAQLDDAWAREDWASAIPLVAQALAFRPDDAALKQKLMSAYFNRAVSQMDDGDLDDALKSYDQALAVIADPQVKAERDALSNYQAGVAQYNQQNWAGTVQYLTKVYAQDAGYLDTRELLYRTYYSQGAALRAAKDLTGAARAYQSAVDLDNTAIEARGELAQVKALLAPPPAKPTPVPQVVGAKWIDINITTQRFRAMRGNTTVYTFLTSTGERGRDTQPGSYKILDKIPNAYSRFWKLWMPYWMGIYWAGASENGIHALPILSNGATLWSGFLGRKVSFGCVILDTASAKLMFNWAEIGTPVTIHY